MAFVSGCPKCQKPVLVPEGHSHDAVVQCPACFVEYSLGEILASIPALVVVRPGSAAAPAEVASEAVSAIMPLREPALASSPAVPTWQESDALDFISEPAAVGPGDGHATGTAPATDHAADELFASAFTDDDGSGGPGVETLAVPMLAPVDGDGHASADAAEKADDWGANWGGFGAEAAHDKTAHAAVAEDTIDLAAHEEDGDGGMAHIDFAAITGKSPPGTAATAGTAVAEPPKKRRRKKERNPIVFVFGLLFFGALAVPCAIGIAMLCGQKFEWLPERLQFNKDWGKSASRKANSQPAPSKTETPPGNASEPQANAPPSADTGKTNAHEQVAGGQGDGASRPGGDTQPAKAGTPAAGDTQPAKAGTPAVAASGQPGTKPRPPAGDDGAMPTDPIGTGPETEDQPPLSQPGKNDLGAPAVVAPVNDKAKTETPSKPQTPAAPAAPNKPETSDPLATSPDTAATPQATAPKIEKPKADKPSIEPKPETPPAIEPAPSVKPETPNKPEMPAPQTIPPETTKPPAAAPKIEKPKTEPAKPSPKPDVKVVDTVGPRGFPTIPAAQLDSALARIGAAAQPAYGDLCQLAETATCVRGATPAQKQALRDAVKKLAGNPQAVARLAADAKKLLDDKATKGGIALSGKVSKLASKNGLFGTAVRIEGMTSAVMVFSSHPLDVKEGDSVLVLGALVSEPAKNLPGYTGTQPVVVWADVATATP